MPKDLDDALDMRLKFIQEAIWNTDDRVYKVLDKLSAHSIELKRLVHLLEIALQGLGILANGNKPKKTKGKH